MKTVSFIDKHIKRFINLSPTRVIVVYFTVLITIGTFLLMLPFSQKQGNSTPLIDALFTSTSASCVTGLVVYDTYNHWSSFGQVVILFLIQFGALGIITLATLFSVMLGRKAGLKGMLLAKESLSHFSFSESMGIVKKVIFLSFIIEFVGAAILSIRFLPHFGLKGIYISVFHSISAFCNAGFDLMGINGKGDYVSLSGISNDPLLIYTFSFLIITGGIGFLVWNNVFNYRKTRVLLFNTQLVLIITTFLIVFGAVLFFVFEMNNEYTIGKMTLIEKINTSVFHSVSPRTAGFNIIDIGATTDITKVLNILLMFIGAAPGSTAGGIKVTTIGILFMAVVSEIAGQQETVILKKRVPYASIIKSLTVIMLAFSLITIVSSLLLLIENKPFLQVLFETTSAFGTVGLSTGITPSLHGLSKFLLIITMFLGRVGLLTFAISLSLKHNRNRNSIYPEGKVVVG